MLDLTQISGDWAFSFLKKFNYIRASGTPAEKRAAEKIYEELKQLGLSPETEPFPFETNQIDRAVFRVTEPYEKDYVVKAYKNSANTKAGGLSAPFFYVENGDAISLANAKGKIALINNRVEEKEYHKLVKAGVSGFVSIYGTPLDSGIDRIPEDSELHHIKNAVLPGLCIHYQDAREIVERGAQAACMQVEQSRVSRQSQNIIVRIQGAKKPDEVLVLTAHYDSVPAGPGAYDNMAGAAIIMEVCRYFTKHPPERTLEFAFLGAEECGLQGSLAFARKRADTLSQYLLNLNVDLAGQPVGGTVLGVTADSSLCDALEKLLWQGNIGAEIKHEVWSSDSNTFALHGVPALTLDRDGFGMHTCYDTVDLISPWALERDGRLLAFLVHSLDGMEQMPFRRQIPEEMLLELRRYFGE